MTHRLLNNFVAHCSWTLNAHYAVKCLKNTKVTFYFLKCKKCFIAAFNNIFIHIIIWYDIYLKPINLNILSYWLLITIIKYRL